MYGQYNLNFIKMATNYFSTGFKLLNFNDNFKVLEDIHTLTYFQLSIINPKRAISFQHSKLFLFTTKLVTM